MPTLELSMIVKDGGASLGRCLASAAPLVDRMVVGDTGSSDDTVEIARSFGAEVVSIAWTDDFAAARNRMLAHARMDWILVLDADEEVETEQAGAVLPGLLGDAEVFAYTLERWDYVARMDQERPLQAAKPNPGRLPGARAWPGYVSSFHTRLFRRDPRVCFRDCVHEQITDEVDRHGLLRAPAPLVLHHFGYVESSAAGSEEKIRLYHRLGLRKAAEEPLNFEAHLQLGVAELSQLNHPGEALALLRRASELRPEHGRAHLLMAMCHLRLGEPRDAQRSLARAKFLGESGATFHDTLGDSFLQLGQYGRALCAYRQTHVSAGPVPTPIVQAKIGVAITHLGHRAMGLALIRKALERFPQSPSIPRLLAHAEEVAAGSVGL